MTHAVDLPAWAALLTAFLLLLGAGLTLLGADRNPAVRQLLRTRSCADPRDQLGNRRHRDLRLSICFSVLGSRPVVHEMLVGIFMIVTTPVTLMLLARAALYRDRTEGDANVPPRSPLRLPGGNLLKDRRRDDVR